MWRGFAFGGKVGQPRCGPWPLPPGLFGKMKRGGLEDATSHFAGDRAMALVPFFELP